MPAFTIKATAVSLVVALTADPASAFWRMSCPGRLVLERVDPIVNAGGISGHVHTVSGGSGFGFNTSFSQQRNSACSSCPIKADLSAYWTPKLYWRNKDNTQFIDVPQAGEYNGNTGGMTTYYQQRYSKGETTVKAFPPEFRMLAGNPFARSYKDVPAAPGQAVSFKCLNYAGTSTETKAMPNTKCPDGVYFPSCWDGVNKDSADHKSHMSYPINGGYDHGSCPSTHPVRLISLFFEVIYSTSQFDSKWWSNTQHPFVFAMGDTTGYGFHGDFVNGWDVDTLQRAADTCTNDSGNISDCPVFNNGLYGNDDCQACRLPTQIQETITGNLTALPGCNPVSSGPQDATPGACDAARVAAPQIGMQNNYFTDLTSSQQWSYAGCGKDSYYTRTFTGASKSDAAMTVEMCVAFCKGKGFSLAGLEYGKECYCDNKFATPSNAPQKNVFGACNMPCAGNSAQTCGGPGALSVYKACAGSSGCTNAQIAVNGTLSGSTGGSPAAASSAGPVKVVSSAMSNATKSTVIRKRHFHHHKAHSTQI